MGFFTWNDAYVLGVRLFDSEHKMLFALADELNEAIARGENARTQRNLMNRFLGALQTHVEHEEALMKHYGFADTEDHALEHRDIVSQVVRMKQKLDAGAIGLPLDSLSPLKSWFDRHIRHYDQTAARHIRQHEMAGLYV